MRAEGAHLGMYRRYTARGEDCHAQQHPQSALDKVMVAAAPLVHRGTVRNPRPIELIELGLLLRIANTWANFGRAFYATERQTVPVGIS